jgi:phosphatidylglycerophosphate synthase
VSDIVNPANAVTASRFLTLPPFAIFIDRGMYQWAVVMIILCGLGDLLDGKVARLFNCMSGFGELFDAIADAACYGFFMVVLLVYDRVPLVPVALIVALGVANAVMRAVYARRAGRATNYRSFAMERLVAYSAYLGGMGTAAYEVDYFFTAFLILMVIVVIHDAKRMLIDPVPA